jgi:hypothetical protein
MKSRQLLKGTTTTVATPTTKDQPIGRCLHPGVQPLYYSTQVMEKEDKLVTKLIGRLIEPIHKGLDTFDILTLEDASQNTNNIWRKPNNVVGTNSIKEGRPLQKMAHRRIHLARPHNKRLNPNPQRNVKHAKEEECSLLQLLQS